MSLAFSNIFLPLLSSTPRRCFVQLSRLILQASQFKTPKTMKNNLYQTLRIQVPDRAPPKANLCHDCVNDRPAPVPPPPQQKANRKGSAIMFRTSIVNTWGVF